jgi:hypothetical protein
VASRGGDSQSFAPGGSAPRLRALRPVCEELARTDPVARRSASLGGAAGEGEARRPAQNRHGGAPRGERLRETQGASQGVWRAALRHAPPVHRAPERYLGAPPPLIPGARSKKQNPGAKTRRGNEKGCVKWCRWGSAWQRTRSAPSPVHGGGLGRGRASANLLACPLPIPPPQVGEGTHRVRGKSKGDGLCEDERACLESRAVFFTRSSSC